MKNFFFSIQSKRQAPDWLETHLFRERLSLERYRTVLENKIIVLAAPAGYGKSILLRQWWKELQNHQEKMCWLSLGEEENDPGCLLEYLITTIIAMDTRLRRKAFAVLQQEQQYTLKSIFNILLKELSHYPYKWTFFLDNMHHIHDPEVKHLLLQFIAHSPKNCRWVLSSREALDQVFQAFKLENHFLQFDLNNLKFSLREIELFFQQKNIFLKQEQLEKILQSTEAWPAGLQLIALTLKHCHSLEDVLDHSIAKLTISPHSSIILHFLNRPHIDITLNLSNHHEMGSTLTKREIEILQLLESGLKHESMAKQLFISVSTLRFHLRNIYQKLGVHNRSGAIAQGRELGISKKHSA